MPESGHRITYQMRSQRDCGPAALAFVLWRVGRCPAWEQAYAECISQWPGGWKDRDSIMTDLNDQDSDHRKVIESLGRFQIMVTLTDILSGKHPADTVVVLIHGGLTTKHWIVWHETTTEHVRCHWGDGTIKDVPIDDFVDLFTQSFPNCSYTVTSTAPRLSWWQRARRFLGGLVAKWT